MRWGLAGGIIIGLHLLLTALSHRFVYGSDMLSRPIPLFIGMTSLAGIAYLIAVQWARKTDPGNGLLVWIVAVGLVIRLLAFASSPVLEDDYYRYLWEGGVLANGHDPFAYSPHDVTTPDSGGRQVPPSLRQLAVESGSIVERVNHPGLRTIYPPVAQIFFAISHKIAPWSLNAWRTVLLGVDLTILFLLIALLRSSRLPILLCAVYWWNPLLVKEIFNSGHMDIVVFPFLLGALWMASREQYGRSAGLLALATGVKVWPILLLPLLLFPIAKRPARLIPALLAYLVPVALISLPILTSGLDPGSGFTAYGERWEMNDALFKSVARLTAIAIPATGLLSGFESLIPRLLVLIALAAWVGRITLRDGRRDLPDLCERSLLIVAGLFLLSPTQFPWYSLWFLPLLAIRPRTSLLLLTALLPIYYLRFHFRAIGRVDIFDDWVVWAEYLPVWIVLIREWYVTRKGFSIRKEAV